MHTYLSYPNPINMLGSHALSTIFHCNPQLDTWDRDYLARCAGAVLGRCATAGAA